MSIKALPADACRLLGSTTVIATPVSLVKELVDNAIDADATAIDVIVSPNTVDKIEVRDNGHGVSPADFDALGRRGHTSKIRCFEDLKTVGGTSLGFRGEGLASANTLGYVAITTRTADVAIASNFRLVPALGGISEDGHKPVPAPVGTTVFVTCLFSALPVRRKVAVQDVMKTMNAIKTLLGGYAMARPHLRLSFKALKEAVPTWSYRPTMGSSIPHGNSDMRQSVAMLFGAEAARQCQEIITSTDDLLDGQFTLSQSMSSTKKEKPENFVFEAWLPRPDADLSKPRQGVFVSVDGRPVSFHHNGIVDRLQTIFHTSFGRLLSQMSSPQHSKVRGTFMRLNIKCPAGTYDANVDSAKTDVLFTDEKFLCDAFARLCAKTFVPTEHMRFQSSYGKYPPSTPVRAQPTISFGGSAYGGTAVSRSQTQSRPLQHRPSQGIDDSPLQGCMPPPFADTTSGMRPRREARRTGEQSPLSQLNSLFTDVPVEAPRVRHNPRTAGGIEYDFTSSRGAGVQRRTTSAANSRHVRLSPVRKRAPIRSRQVGGLRTPPSSSPMEENQPGISQNHGQTGSPGLSVLVSNDGFRQKTRSFGDRGLSGNHMAEADEEQLDQGRPSRHSFMSARELFTHGPAEVGPSLPITSRSDNHQPRPEQYSERAGQVTPGLCVQPTPASQEMVPKRPIQTVRIDQKKLRRSAAAFARNTKTWDEELEYLSPEMADISSIKSRLRAAIVDWLAKTKEERKEAGAGSVQVEFYLRKSLKKKALLVRDLEQ